MDIRANIILLTGSYLLLIAMTACQNTPMDQVSQNSIDRYNEERIRQQDEWLQNDMARASQQKYGPVNYTPPNRH